MAFIHHFATLVLTLLSIWCFSAPVSVAVLVKEQPLILKYHNGALLKGNVTVNLIWYGGFTSVQRSVIVDFVNSLSSSSPQPSPSVASWWETTSKYKGGVSKLVVGNQIISDTYELGKSLNNRYIIALASKPRVSQNSVNVVITDKDVMVEGFCMNRCGSHGSTPGKLPRTAYLWVGNSVSQCPGQCAWPFYKPTYGPQTTPLIPPNGDFGVDGIIINLATVLAGAVTNPFGNGYFQGSANAPLEAVSACTGIFGTGSYPGYPGRVLVDKVSGASYNANGLNGRKYLLPAMWDPITSKCTTLV